MSSHFKKCPYHSFEISRAGVSCVINDQERDVSIMNKYLLRNIKSLICLTLYRKVCIEVKINIKILFVFRVISRYRFHRTSTDLTIHYFVNYLTLLFFGP